MSIVQGVKDVIAKLRDSLPPDLHIAALNDQSLFVKAALSRDHELIYPPVQEFWDGAVGPG